MLEVRCGSSPSSDVVSPSMRPASFASLAAGLLLARAPFLWTGHVQDDAYISFRTAFNLADHGQLSFNLGEHYAASTSLLYAYVSALLRALAGDHAVTVILVVNAVVASVAVVQLARVFALSGARAVWFVVTLGLSTGALLPAFNGMETAWCLLYVAVLCEHVGSSRISPALFGLLLMASSFVRPDAVFLAASAWTLRAMLGGGHEQRRLLWGAVGIGLGVLSCAALNRLHSGTWLSPSIQAKLVAYRPGLALADVLQRIGSVYLEGPLSLLPSTQLIPTWLMVGASSLTLFALGKSVVRARLRGSKAASPEFLFLAGVAGVFPLLFALAVAHFPWYFHPSSFALAACLLVAIERQARAGFRQALTYFAAGVSLIGCAVQLLVSISVGRQESGYRAGVGKYLATVAAPEDTLVLEPAGHIPYFSRLTTYDEVGLTSPRVLAYLSAFHGAFLGEFLRDICPSFTVQRRQFPPAPAAGVSWTPAEAWFHDHYRLIREFVYDPRDWARSNLELQILRFGSHSDYLVYRRDDAACDDR